MEEYTIALKKAFMDIIKAVGETRGFIIICALYNRAFAIVNKDNRDNLSREAIAYIKPLTTEEANALLNVKFSVDGDGFFNFFDYVSAREDDGHEYQAVKVSGTMLDNFIDLFAMCPDTAFYEIEQYLIEGE